LGTNLLYLGTRAPQYGDAKMTGACSAPSSGRERTPLPQVNGLRNNPSVTDIAEFVTHISDTKRLCLE
jgi:hypothetical protein